MKLATRINIGVQMTLRGLVCVALTGVYPSCVAWADSPDVFRDTFPRIGSPQIATISWEDPALRDRVAKQHLTILGFWKGYQTTDLDSGQVMGIADVVADIRARAAAHGNPGILIFKYSSINEASDNLNSAFNDVYNKLHGEDGPGDTDWWARTSDGSHTSSWRGEWNTNVTRFVKRDANGYTYPEWRMGRDYNLFFADGSFDGMFIDNFFFRPRVDADWNGDGRDDSPDDMTVRSWLRAGYVDAVNRIHALDSDLFVIGNVEGHPMTGEGMLTEPDFQGLVGAFFEHAMGMDHSVEVWGGWNAMMEQYRTLIANARYGVVIFGVAGEPTDYAMMRYGLTSCLMDDGYYSYSESLYEHVGWYDEFDADLGRAIDAPPTAPWKQGVYMRRFDNGMAIVNPRGNGQQTVSIPSGYRRISGMQDPAVNNGQVATSVTLNERDGIILLTEVSSKRPKPPAWVSR